jgi:site-specific recombinase XerC
MSEQLIHAEVEPPTTHRSRRGLRGQKPPLKVREIWAIRIRLQLEERIRDLAMFNRAIDSKLRACDLTALRVDGVAMSGRVKSRAIVIQKKTGRPVQFEITEQTRDTVARWIDTGGLRPGGFLFPSRICVGRSIRTRQYARLVSRWISSLGLDPTSYDTHSLRRTKPTLIYRRTGNLRAVQLLLGHTNLDYVPRRTMSRHGQLSRSTARWYATRGT